MRSNGIPNSSEHRILIAFLLELGNGYFACSTIMVRRHKLAFSKQSLIELPDFWAVARNKETCDHRLSGSQLIKLC